MAQKRIWYLAVHKRYNEILMEVHTNIPLKNYTTMRLGGNARFMTDIHSIDEIAKICASAKTQNLPIFVLGGGSNIIVKDEGFDGVVLRNRIKGFEVISDTPEGVTIKIGAGEDWDEAVKRTVDMNLTGIEAMSGIPGTAGAAPVQNIGAYGQEIAETLQSLEAYDIQNSQAVSLQASDCGFSYRSSIFRTSEVGRYVIASITLRLYRTMPAPPFYSALQSYFDAHSINIYTPGVVRDAVLAIRSNKLPDPRERPNAGSFFKNAVIEGWLYDELRKEYEDMPSYDMPGGMHKIPTGWLIEQCGFKGSVLHGMKVHDGNALVLINESAASYADLAAARDEIAGAVRDKFCILIEQEPLEI